MEDGTSSNPSTPTPVALTRLFDLLKEIQHPGCLLANLNGSTETSSCSSSWRTCDSSFDDFQVAHDVETANPELETSSSSSWRTCDSSLDDSEVANGLETANPVSPEQQETGTGSSTSLPTSQVVMCFKCRNCEYAIRLDKLKRDISYVQTSFCVLSMFERDFEKFLQPLENGASFHMESPWFKQLTSAVLQLKFQLPDSSYYKFQEVDGNPMSQHQDTDLAVPNSTPNTEFISKYRTLDLVEKKCLWCFSVFDGEVKRRALINWWVGQGLLDGGSMTLELAGEKMLAELTNKLANYIQQVNKRGREVDCWKIMEPSVCWFLRSKAKEANFFDFKADSSDVEIMFLKSDNLIQNLDIQVKTVFNINKSSIADSEAETLAYMESLTVLHLGRSSNTPKRNIQLKNLKSFKKRLSRMKDLRLLSLQGISSIRELPGSVCELSNLMVLDLSACQALESLPSKIGSLKRLTHLDVSGCLLLVRMPKGISLLTNLEVLKGFVIPSKGNSKTCSLGDLVKLKKLHKLTIFVWKNDFPQPQDLKDLFNIKGLVKLKIIWKPASLHSPQQTDDPELSRNKLCKMFLSCFGNQVESEISGEFLSLEKLDLWCAPSDMLLAPNKYPMLKKLYIRGRLKLDPLKEPGSNGSWTNVETLRLLYLPDLEMNLEDFSPPGLFPKLSYLQYKKPDQPENENDFWVKPGEL